MDPYTGFTSASDTENVAGLDDPEENNHLSEACGG